MGAVASKTWTWQSPALNADEFVLATWQHAFPIGTGLPGRVWQTGQPAWITDVVREPNFPRSAAAAKAGLHGAFGFPIRVGTEVEGVIELYRREIREPDEQLLKMVTDVGLKIGQFGERARAEEALRRTEVQLQQSQKMEAVGRLAGGVAHDFNNMLTVMIGFAEQLETEIGGHESLTQVVRAAQRAADLTRQLLAFSRQQVLRPQVVDVAGVVTSMGGMVDRIIGDDVVLSIDAPGGLPSVCADPTQLEQIVMNLAINARDAMSRGGRLTITVRRAVLDTPRPGRGVQPAGEYVQLTVADTGAGIPADLLNKVFEPFFTTKGIHGTGLGLSTVYGIVKQSGGFIWVDSELGVGTTFTIDLPVTSAQKETVPVTPRVSSATERRPGGRILVVEDLESVRALTREMLQTEGYDVLEASTPHEALGIVDTLREPLDLVLSDVMMPEMNGSELVSAIREKKPGVPVLFMSGLPKALEWSEPEAFLPKPFTRAALLSQVRLRMASATIPAKTTSKISRDPTR